jgi:phage tail tube protein FII
VIRKLFIYPYLCLVALSALSLDQALYAQERTAETVAFCKLTSQLNKYRGNPVTLRVRVDMGRHATLISDRACPKQSLFLIADQAAVQTDSLSHFYKFLVEHRRGTKPIFATITGRVVKGEDGGFVLKRDLVFKLESVSEIPEGR